MDVVAWLPLLGVLITSVLGGGCLGHWMTNRRLSPKSKAEARDITAAAMDKDWTRFQREIGRLVKRLEDAERKADRAKEEAEEALSKLHECEEREIRLKTEIAELAGQVFVMGQARQQAATIVAADRLDQRKKGGDHAAQAG